MICFFAPPQLFDFRGFILRLSYDIHKASCIQFLFISFLGFMRTHTLAMPCWAHLGLSWTHLGLSWVHFGLSQAIFGPSRDHRKHSLGCIGLILGSLGPAQAILGASWYHLRRSWAILGQSSAKGPKNFEKRKETNERLSRSKW